MLICCPPAPEALNTSSLISAGKLDVSNGYHGQKFKLTHTSSEQALKAGRKRTGDNYSLDVSTDLLPEQGQNSKRRRQQENAAVNISQDASDRRYTSCPGRLIL